MARKPDPIHSLTGRLGLAIRYGRPEQAQELRGDLAVAQIRRAVMDSLEEVTLNDAQKADLRSIVDEAVA